MRRAEPAFLPAGRALASWLRAQPEARHAPRMLLWIYRWKAYWFDRNWRIQEALFPVPDFAGEGGRNVIFVLGFWRTGTTLLHEMLASGPRMSAPRTWQCMNPSGFRIGGPPKSHPTVSRPMDAMLVNALSPQEDEFALLARGAPSAYRTWLDPRRWEEILPALEQETWIALRESQWLADWRTFLGWCVPDAASTLVVKSPNHVFRIKALHRVWPQARFVWTLRDPVESWYSNRKMWRAMTAMYGLWQWRAGDLDRFLLKAMSEYASALRWAADTLDADTATYVGFNHLTLNTVQVLKTLTKRLHLGPWETWLPLLSSRLSETAKHRQELYEGTEPLPAYAETLFAQVRQLHRQLIREA